MSTNNEQHQPVLYTEEQLMARLKFFIGICLALTLTGIVFVVLYSLIFVTQPLNAISPIDQKFFELIIPIATFLTGTLSGIMLSNGDKDAQAAALKAANSGWDRPPTPVSPTPVVTNSFGSQPLGGLGNVGSTTSAPGFAGGSSAFGSPTPGGFGAASAVPTPGGLGSTPSTTVNPVPGWGTTPVSTTPAVITGFGGKPAPAPQVDPVI